MSERDEDWIDRATKLAGRLGMNEVQVRWKLTNLQARFTKSSQETAGRVRHIGYAHKLCPRCGGLEDRTATRCARCEAPLASHRWHLLARVGLAAPEGLSTWTALVVAIVAVYARMWMLEAPGSFPLSFSVDALYRFGGHWPPAVRDGEVWRLGSAVFVHAGVWHLAFNALALTQVGPRVEELFGRARLLVFFIATGLVASIASHFFLGGVGIGASGAVMGLIGVAAGWGQRDGTTVGKAVRNGMLQWALYTLVFGFFIGADNVAHAAGFLAGAVFGYLVPADWQRRAALSPAWLVAFGAAVVVTVVSLACALLPVGGAPPW